MASPEWTTGSAYDDLLSVLYVDNLGPRVGGGCYDYKVTSTRKAPVKRLIRAPVKRVSSRRRAAEGSSGCVFVSG